MTRTEWLSKRGGRETNQDACGYLELAEGACWVVADGLGGHRGGETAARLAVEAVLSSFRRDREVSPAAIESHILAAHEAILEQRRESPELNGMRTTIVVLLTDYESYLWGHVGDSRLYAFRGGSLRFQTRDHSVPQMLADAGDIHPDKIRHHPDRNRLLRSLGTDEPPLPVVQQEKRALHGDDAFLLCVDGFWEHVLETEMEVDFAKSRGPGDWLTRMEGRILQRAGDDSDNHSAIAVFFAELRLPSPTRNLSAHRQADATGGTMRKVKATVIFITSVLALLLTAGPDNLPGLAQSGDAQETTDRLAALLDQSGFKYSRLIEGTWAVPVTGKNLKSFDIIVSADEAVTATVKIASRGDVASEGPLSGALDELNDRYEPIKFTLDKTTLFVRTDLPVRRMDREAFIKFIEHIKDVVDESYPKILPHLSAAASPTIKPPALPVPLIFPSDPPVNPSVAPPSPPNPAVDTKPVALNRPEPSYTETARANGVQGAVRVRVLVGADGAVKRAYIIRGLPDGLDEEAVKAAYKMRFRPAMKDGQAVAYWVPVDVQFNLR